MRKMKITIQQGGKMLGLTGKNDQLVVFSAFWIKKVAISGLLVKLVLFESKKVELVVFKIFL